MKLDEAISLGAMLGPHVFGALVDPSKPDSSCAMGSAFRALGLIKGDEIDENRILAYGKKLIEWSDKNHQRCPICGSYDGNITSVIVHMNNQHCWPRSAIAIWVASVETRELPEAEREAISSLSPAVADSTRPLLGRN